MAEQILYGVVEQLVTKLGSSAFQEIKSVCGFKTDLKKFQNSLSTVEAVLLDADEEKRKKNRAMESWIMRLQDIVYDADDLFDDLTYQELKWKIAKGNVATRVGSFFSSSNRIWLHSKMSHRIKDLTERLNEVKNDISVLNLVGREIREDGKSIGLRETDSYVQKLEIIGREEDTQNIIDSLLCVSGQRQATISLVAIVGLGGLGKTTVAQLVYNDEIVGKHFEKRLWVCVSEEFDVKLLMKKILKCLTSEVVDNLEREQLQVKLRENLDRKRYLLVLDDVWSEDGQKWDDLRKYLLVGATGSKVLVTTRSKKVALVMGVDSPYELVGLSENQSWDLFEKLAFGKRQSIEYPQLVKIGKEIVRKCKGVPLAIRSLGCLMRSRTSENEWLSLLNNNDLWRSWQSSGDIIPVLKLSYDHLPTHLRQCFAYCAIFPKDYEFFELDRAKLIYLWMAQGYIVASNSNECLEEIGEQYFNELLFRSFFQSSENRFGRNCYIMHDLIHDLAQSIAKDSCINVVEKNNIEKVSGRVRHLYCAPRVDLDTLQFSLLKAIRTLVVDSYKDRVGNLNMITPNCQRLRALLCHSISKEVLSSIGKLKHLRYLDISYSGVKTLPISINNLHNLQTLILIDCYRLQELPRDIRRLTSLRCLLFDGCDRINGMPMGLGKLTCLERLSYFRVGEDQGTLNELGHLNQLRGFLIIEGLKNVKIVESESNNVNLLGKEHLQILSLIFWGSEFSRLTDEESELLLENLLPHPNLQQLHVKDYPGVRFSNWLSCIRNLIKITLEFCPNLKQLPPLGQLPCLKTLHLYELEALECISDEGSDDNSSSCSSFPSTTCFFPSLQELDIIFCSNLKGWWRRRNNNQVELRQFPSLSRLYVGYCEKLTHLPEGMCQVTSLQELIIYNCPELSDRCREEIGVDWPNISHIPNITIEGYTFERP